MFRSHFVGALALSLGALCACSLRVGSQVPLAQTPELGAAPSTATPLRKEGTHDDFHCSPEKLYRGDKLTITMSVPHAGELAILSPDKTFFYYAFGQENRTLPAQPVVQAREFRSIKSL